MSNFEIQRDVIVMKTEEFNRLMKEFEANKMKLKTVSKLLKEACNSIEGEGIMHKTSDELQSWFSKKE